MPETLHGPRRLGDFLLLAEIARGATGVVWHARRISIGRPCALKLLIGGLDAAEADRARFHLEAEAAASLDHPNIIRVHGAGEVDGHLYLEMELLPGETLADRLAAGPVSPRRAAEWTRCLAEGLAHAHARGVLHRDIKPGNVLVAEDGTLKLGDFGMARMLAQPSDLTLTFGVVGTPMYLAPEVARQGAAAATTASDLYSLGAVFHEMLAGQPPRRSRDALRVLAEIQEHPLAAPSRARPGLPPDLDVICQRCTAEDAGRRFPTALELACELGRHLRGEPILSRPVSPLERLVLWTRRRRAVAAMAGVALVALLAGVTVAAWQWRRARAVDDHLRDRLVLGPMSDAEQFAREGLSDIALLRMAAILRQHPGHAPTRQRLAQWLALPDVCPVPRRTWTHDVGARKAGYSGDGRCIWVALDDGRVVVHCGGSAGEASSEGFTVDGVGPESLVALNADGSRMVSWQADRRLVCWRAPAAPGAKPGVEWEMSSVRSAALSLNQQHGVAVTSDGHLWSVPVTSEGPPRRWPGVQVAGVDGLLCVSASGHVVVQSPDGRTMRVLRWKASDPVPVAEQAIVATNGPPLAALHMSPLATWLVGQAERNAWTWDLRTGQPLDRGRIRLPPQGVVGVTMDGRHVVHASDRGVFAQYVANGVESFAWRDLRHHVGSLGLSRGTGRMALGGEDGRLLQRRGPDGGFAAGAAHPSPIRSVAYHPVEDAILAAHGDGAVVETTAWTGGAHVVAREVAGKPLDVPWLGSRNEALLVSPAGLRTWAPADPDTRGQLEGLGLGALVAAYSEAAGCVLTVAADDPVVIRAVRPVAGSEPAALWRESEPVLRLWAQSGGEWLMGAGASVVWARRWDGTRWQPAGSWKLPGVHEVVYRPGGAEACVVDDAGRPHHWMATPGLSRLEPMDAPFPVVGVAFTRGGDHVLWVSQGREARLVPWGRPPSEGRALVAKGDIRAHAVSGTHVVLASKRAVTVWDLRVPGTPIELAGGFRPIDSIALSPDSRWVAVHSDDTWLSIHEVETGLQVGRSHALGDKARIPGPWSIRFTPDGGHAWGWNTNGGVFSMPMIPRIPSDRRWTEVLIDLAEHAASDPVVTPEAAPAHRARLERLRRARARGTWLPQWDRFLGGM